MGIFGQLWQFLKLFVVVGGIIIALGTMFPDGELMAGAQQLGEGIVNLFSEIGDALSGAV